MPPYEWRRSARGWGCKSLSGKGLERIDSTKTEAARRTIQLPWFAVETLRARRGRPYLGQQAVIFPSMAGTLRDPNNFGKQWRTIRAELGSHHAQLPQDDRDLDR
jgi:hypothetical protein